MFRNGLEPWHVVVIALILVLLFGSKRLPDAARGLGRSLRIFKSEMRSMAEDDKPVTGPGESAPPTASGDSTIRPETPPRVDG